MENNKLTLKDIAAKANCPPYIVRYLHTCKRLTVLKDSTGAGDYVEFAPESIEQVKAHLSRTNRNK